jgi:hypothetical protein
MLRRALSVCAVLGFVSAAHAGVAITLVPQPGQAEYQPGDVVNVDVMAQLTSGTPSVPGPAGTTSLIRVRLMQFDFRASDAALGISPVLNHPDSDLGGNLFWDFSGSTTCVSDPANCGGGHFIDGTIAGDDLVSIVFLSQSTSSSGMVRLTQANPIRVGAVSITLPTDEGTYILDVLNSDDPDTENRGARVDWGFGGTSPDPSDPSSPLRATDGDFTGGSYEFTVVPEPATLALLGLGGAAAAFRRRRTA